MSKPASPPRGALSAIPAAFASSVRKNCNILLLRFQRFFSAEPDSALFIDIEHADADFISFLEDIRHRVHPFVGELRDMNETFDARENFHERSEVDDALHNSIVNPSDLGFLGEPLDNLKSALSGC